MRIRFYCDSGANAFSRREETLDVEKDLGFTPEEWKAMSEKDKQKEAEEWAWQRLEFGYKELDA